jgi:tripartite ATP-independent transporter DctM subunit
MNSGKVTENMFTFTKALVGNKRGALAYINIIISLIFSGMTGSAAADAAGIGIMEIKEMKKDGYDAPFSAAITAATATVGPIFPPSIPLVVYALLAGVSIGKLFAGGMVPAILICLVLGFYVWYISKKRDYPRGVKFTVREFLKFTWKALPALFTPVILLGGIYSGIVTATEAGALAAFYAIIVSVFFYRCMTLKSFIKIVKDTVIQTGAVMIIVAAAFVMSYVVTSSGLGKSIADLFLGLTNNIYIFLIIINIAFLFLGMLFDTQVLMYVFIPLVLPVAQALGIDMVHFGVIIVVNIMIGLSSPPYGTLCFITSGIAKTPLQKVFREVIPMVVVMIIVLLVITYIPEIVMAIPNLMY